MQRFSYNLHLIFIRHLYYQRMKKLTLKLYDKLIVGILFSALFAASCKPDEPVPAYGIVPMYGVPVASSISTHKAPQTSHPHAE